MDKKEVGFSSGFQVGGYEVGCFGIILGVIKANIYGGVDDSS
jgi:hypothetical protein